MRRGKINQIYDVLKAIKSHGIKFSVLMRAANVNGKVLADILVRLELKGLVTERIIPRGKTCIYRYYYPGPKYWPFMEALEIVYNIMYSKPSIILAHL